MWPLKFNLESNWIVALCVLSAVTCSFFLCIAGVRPSACAMVHRHTLPLDDPVTRARLSGEIWMAVMDCQEGAAPSFQKETGKINSDMVLSFKSEN